MYIIPDLSTLISNMRDSIVCSVFWQSISQSRGKYFVVITNFFYRSEKKTKINRKKLIFKFVRKDSNVKNYFIK